MGHRRSAYLLVSGCLAALASVMNPASAESIDLLCARTHVFGSPLAAARLYISLFRDDKKVLIHAGDQKPEEYTNHVETDATTPQDDTGVAVTTCQNMHKTFAKFDARHVFWGKEEIGNRCGSVDDRSEGALPAKDHFNPYYDFDKRTGTLLYFGNISRDKFESQPADEVFGCELE